jgi:hypothetical protein
MKNSQIFYIFIQFEKLQGRERNDEDGLQRKSENKRLLEMRLKSSTIVCLYYLQFG